ncbi:hypothetical protein ILYODFUR_026987 [Ilyodon furcidens]|uniref:Ly6/PLAUR domain-containing protein 1-like n=1 Tax=Ilyodon furcidens TaxID=33524 RepID=A0ABV0V6F6_9TELE
MRMPVHQQRDSERLQEEDGGAQHFSESQAGRMRLWTFSAVLLSLFGSGLALQIQCYQCEMTQDCATPEFIVNCTVNVQDMCQKEVLVKDDGKSDLQNKLHLLTMFHLPHLQVLEQKYDKLSFIPH